MLFSETLIVAINSIRANPFRASLTILGIVIGVAAVITMVALGSGAQRAIDEQMDALGGDILQISSGGRWSHGIARDQLALTVDDSAALARDAQHLSAVVPEINGRFQVKLGNKNLNIEIVGTTPNYVDVHRFELAHGRMFNAADNASRRRVAVLGSDIPVQLEMDAASLVGRTIAIRAIDFLVVGIMEEKGSMGWSRPDNDIWIPIDTARFRVFGDDKLNTISVKVGADSSVDSAMVDIERVMRREHKILPGKDNDFTIYDRKTYLTAQQGATEVFTYLLGGIAAVSLVVGGIGIMNIMLVTVTERTREIGIRKALGATRQNILMQFLIESMVLCLIGGALGLMVGSGASMLLAKFAGWQTVVTMNSGVTAFSFSALIGIFFGIWPAQRAAKLDPINALRHD
jgi:putative ABC transport system permease protein